MKKILLTLICCTVCFGFLFANDFEGKVFEIKKAPKKFKGTEYQFVGDNLMISNTKTHEYSQYTYAVSGNKIFLKHAGGTDIIGKDNVTYKLSDGTAQMELNIGSEKIFLYDTGRKAYRSELINNTVDHVVALGALYTNTVAVKQGYYAKQSKYEKGGYSYKKDTEGRITEVSGRLRLEEGIRNKTAQKLVGGEDRLPTDQGGHLIARRFGGSGDFDNLVPMDQGLNQGQWKRMENNWTRILEGGGNVDVNIRVFYGEQSQRPVKFVVQETINGEISAPKVFYN